MGKSNNPKGGGNWYKGMPSPNAAGRKLKGFTIADLFAKEGDQPHILIDKNGKKEVTTRRQALIRVAYDRAIGGDDGYTRLCLEREYGKVLEEIQLLHGKTSQIDWSKYKPEQLIALRALLKIGEPDDADAPDNA
jgi:hypothetical protein